MNEYSVCWRGAPTLFLLESHTILTQVLIYCFCAIYSRVTSVGAIFYSFSQLCSGSELMNGLRGKNYKTRNHLRSIELMFSFATILLRKSSNLAQALTTMMSTKNSNDVNRPNLKSELGLEDLLSWWRSPLFDCLDGIVGHLVPLFKFPVRFMA